MQDSTNITKILIADADAGSRERVGRAMKGNPLQLWSVGTAAEAKAVLKRELPHLVILDPDLPDTDGFSLLIKIREEFNREEIPVMVISKDPTEDTAILAIREGANDYITKPFVIPVLTERINTTISAYRTIHDKLEKERINTILADLDDTVNALSYSLAGALNELEVLAEDDSTLSEPHNDQINVILDQVKEANEVLREIPFGDWPKAPATAN